MKIMKPVILACSAAFLLTGCGKGLGEEITAEAFGKILEEMDVVEPETVKGHFKIQSSGNDALANFEMDVDYKDGQEMEGKIEVIYEAVSFFHISTLGVQLVTYKTEVDTKADITFYQDKGAKTYATKMNVVETLAGGSSGADGTVQWDENGCPTNVTFKEVDNVVLPQGTTTVETTYTFNLTYTYPTIDKK